MVPHQTHLRIYSVAPSASEPSQSQSIRAGLYCDSTGGSSATEFAANPHFSIYTVGGAIRAWGQYAHEIFFISSDVRAASTSPAGSAAPGRTGRILMPLTVLCNQEPSAEQCTIKTILPTMSCFQIYRSQAQVRRSRMWNVNVPIPNPA